MYVKDWGGGLKPLADMTANNVRFFGSPYQRRIPVKYVNALIIYIFARKEKVITQNLRYKDNSCVEYII